MRRSICYCEPSTAEAGETRNWKFAYTPALNLPKGTRLKFDMLSKGRDIDWEVPSANVKKGKNIIYATLENGKTILAKEVESPDSFTPDFEFILPCVVEAGSSFIIAMGSPKEIDGKKKWNAHTNECSAPKNL